MNSPSRSHSVSLPHRRAKANGNWRPGHRLWITSWFCLFLARNPLWTYHFTDWNIFIEILFILKGVINRSRYGAITFAIAENSCNDQCFCCLQAKASWTSTTDRNILDMYLFPLSTTNALLLGLIGGTWHKVHPPNSLTFLDLISGTWDKVYP